ncbi:MAG: PriCT-2 domain-containing protein [Magnetococcales bacterium]|nr:PriCT-2 domain-containing protein [Magnetococcales bacterium]
MNENFMITHGDKLAAGGFSFLPIMPGEKFPGRFEQGKWFPYKGWTKHATRATTVHELAIWKQWPGAGIGIPGGMVAAVDIDITGDVELADRLHALAFQMLGETQAVRIGQHPKRVLVYRTVTPFKGIKAHPLEVLCQGQQFVAYAIHPGTGRPYEWPVKSLSDLTLADLPAISEEQARAFIDAALALLPEGMRPVRLEQSHADLPVRPVVTGTYHPGTEQAGTPEAVADALRYIVNAELPYDDWVRIGMAIKGALGDAGEYLFADWSASSSKNVAETTARAWESFHPTSIGAGTLYHLAQRNGWKPDASLVLNPANHHPGPHPAEGLLRKVQQAQASPPVAQTAPILAGSSDFDPTDVEGVLKELLEFMLSTAIQPQPLLAVGNALSALGAVMAHRFRSETNLRTNLYVVGIAESGSGKNHSREIINQVFHAASLHEHLGGNRIASGAGLLRAIHRKAGSLFQLDEFGMFLQAAADRKRFPRYITEILDLMTEIHSAAGTIYLGAEYAGIERQDINQPCLCVYGTTTPVVFWSALKSANVADGSLARFLILRTLEDYPERNQRIGSRELPSSLISALEYLSKSGGKGAGNLMGLTKDGTTAITPSVVPMAQEAVALFDDLSLQVTEQLRQHKGSAYSPILARVWEHAAKVAMIRAVAANPDNPVIRDVDACWGIGLVRHSVATLIKEVEQHVADNMVEQNHKRILELIRSAGPKGFSKSSLCLQTRSIPRREREEVIADLLESGSILVEVQLSQGPKPTTFYRLAAPD